MGKYLIDNENCKCLQLGVPQNTRVILILFTEFEQCIEYSL